MQVSHTALWVSDLEATSEFYEEVLGLPFQRSFTGGDGVTNYFVGGDEGAGLQFKHDPDGEAQVDPGSDSGLAHLAVLVDDVDATFEAVVEAADPPVVREPTTVDIADRRVAFVEDPEGYVVEIEAVLED